MQAHITGGYAGNDDSGQSPLLTIQQNEMELSIPKRNGKWFDKGTIEGTKTATVKDPARFRDVIKNIQSNNHQTITTNSTYNVNDGPAKAR